jgi:hypothetical protein
LRVDVRKLTPTKGDVIIVSPRNPRYILSEQYAEFLHNGLKKVANGASVIIATDQISNLNNVKPPDKDEITKCLGNSAYTELYLLGWNAAMETLTKVLGNAV